MNKKEFKGSFFKPTNPEKKTFGIITIDEQGKVTVELFGRLSHRLMIEMESELTLWGQLQNGHPVSLLDAFGKKSRTSLSTGEGSIVYLVNKLVLGIHIEDEDKTCFDSITAEFTYLNSWIRFKNDNLNIQYSKDRRTQESVNYQYKPTANKSIIINDNYKFEIYEQYSFPLDTFSGFSLSKKLLTTIKSARSISLKELFEKLFAIKRLFIILTGRGNKIDFCLIKIGKKQDSEYTENGKITDYECFGNINFARTTTKKTLDPFLKFENIESNLGSIISKWFALEETLFAYMSMPLCKWISSPHIDISSFLNAYQATESVHKILEVGKKESFPAFERGEEDKRILDTLLDQMENEKHASWLKRKFFHNLEKPQSLRVEEIIKKYGNDIFQVAPENLNTTIKGIRKLRNSLIHTGAKHPKEIDIVTLSHYIWVLNLCNLCAVYDILEIPRTLFIQRIKVHFSFWVKKVKENTVGQ